MQTFFKVLHFIQAAFGGQDIGRRYTVFCQCARNSLELLHWGLPTRSEMAKGQKE